MSDSSAHGLRPSVAVVGAGIVGACVAYELQRHGARVTLIDRDEPGRGASYGNSGALSPGSVAPLAMPGAIANVPKMLLDPSGPLYLPPGYLPRALPWLLRFVAAARPARVARISSALAALHAGAIDRHLTLAAEVGAPELIVRRGHLHLYPGRAEYAADAAAWALRREHGFAFEEIDRQRIVELEPAVGPRYQMGAFLADHATVVNPHRYLTRIVDAYVARGGALQRDRVTALSARPAGGWVCIGEQGRHDADHVVIAAGAWSRQLLASVGLDMPLESQRGYHVTFHTPTPPISRTVVLADRKVFLAPMEDGLRIGGTVEFGGLQRPPDPARAKVLARLACETFSGLEGLEQSTWMGHRPCFPDTLPRVGPVDGRAGLWSAFGHGHLGLTDSANTGRLLAELMLETD